MEQVLIALAGGFAAAIPTACLLRAALREGVKCLLRSQITDVYYRYKEEESLPEYERENVDRLYEAYKALRGNSFIEDIYKEMRTWSTLR